MPLSVESRDYTLSEIVPLARQVHANWQKIFGVLMTDTGKEILHLIVARFMARLLTNKSSGIDHSIFIDSPWT
jgi:hypothetical protein